MIAGLEIRPKPRTACTRSSSPGPASTTRASSTTPPTHTDIASTWTIEAITPMNGQLPPVRDRPSVTTANAGMPSASMLVVGSMTRSGLSTTQPDADDEHQAHDRGPPGPVAVEQVEPAGRVEPAAERLALHAGAEPDEVDDGADQPDRPRRAQEPQREHVLGPFRPCGDDEHERCRTAPRCRGSTARGRTRSTRSTPLQRRRSSSASSTAQWSWSRPGTSRRWPWRSDRR